MNCPLRNNFPDLFSGEVGGVFIDDTGSPGLTDTPSHLSRDRKSWVSIVIPPSQMSDILTELPIAIDDLISNTGASEFHFGDIYGGRKEFKCVSIEKRINIFNGFAAIFNHYRFPVHVQTLDSGNQAVETTKQYLIEQVGKTNVPHFDFGNFEHLGLFFLLVRTRDYIRTNFPESNARVFIDAGIFPHGRALKIPGAFSPEFKDDLLCFSDSKLVEPIQLADFAAFCLNRQQLLLGKAELSGVDLRFMEICTNASFNYINIPTISTNQKLWNTEH